MTEQSEFRTAVPDEDPPSVDTLYAELGRTDLSRHLAFFYRRPETQLTVAATFVKRGLESGHRCLYFLDSNTRARVEAAMRSAGVAVDERLAAGDLLIESGTDAYEQAGFDPAELVDRLGEACRESVADGYDGLWIAGETTWCFHTDLSYDHIVDFEADFDAACPDLAVTALCQYDMTQFSENSLAKALWTHEQVVYRGTLCENPFYIPPAEFRSAADRPLNTQLMLEQTFNLAQAKAEVERREQRLSVVNRVLRHNVRNDLNVTRELLDLIREEEYVDDSGADLLITAIDRLNDVTDKADKARYVQRTIGEGTVRRTRVGAVLDRARERIEAREPDATVTVDGVTDATVVADENLDAAITELGRYGLRKEETDPPTVQIDVSTPRTEVVRVEMAYPGPPVPDAERRVLAAGTETQLQHVSGLGLWLATWIVENGNGRLEFPDDGDAQFRLELGRAGD